jgi:thiosulfate/3-mercaptopyruvate sulfurtransferase
LGEAPSADWQGRALKLGHIPGAYNVDYEHNWVDAETKLLKPYAELQRLYAGLDPNRAVVTYYHSGRRSSHTYFVLRLMGFAGVRLYDYSWNEWGNKSLFYPIETKENVLAGPAPNALSMTTRDVDPRRPQPVGDTTNTGGKSGYISCGG